MNCPPPPPPSTWEVMKEAIGKSKILNNDFPKTLLRDKKEINDQGEIASYFNTFFTNIGSNLASKISQSEKHFTSYLNKCDNTLQNNNLSIEEFEKAFSSIKINKASGSNMVKISYKELVIPLFHICENSMKLGIFQMKLKLQR